MSTRAQRARALTIRDRRNRAGDKIAALRPKSAIRFGMGSPSASAAQASPIAGEVWIPYPPCAATQKETSRRVVEPANQITVDDE